MTGGCAAPALGLQHRAAAAGRRLWLDRIAGTGDRHAPDPGRGAYLLDSGKTALGICGLAAGAAVETYTVAELAALTAFYDTEIGARAIIKSGRVMQSFNARSAPVLRGLFERLGARIRAELKE